MGTSADHSDPDHRISFNRSVRCFTGKAFGKSPEIHGFGALCTALSATIGTGNIVGVATAIAAGGPGALFWMVVAAFFGMATKYAEGLLAIKYRTIDKDGHVLGGPFYYIENGMGKQEFSELMRLLEKANAVLQLERKGNNE